MSIKIYVNGKIEDLGNNINITELLSIKKIRPEVVTVELNDKILERSKYNETFLKESDRIEFVYYMGGGHAV